MSLVGDITGAYRHPVRAMRRQIERPGEERILLFALLFCFLSFVADMPSLLAIGAVQTDADQIYGLVASGFVATVLMRPLAMYLLAAVSHVIVRLFGGQATWQQSRLAFMWAAVVTLPVVLVMGVLKVLVPDVAFKVAPIATGVVFLWQWGVCLRLVEFAKPAE